MFVVKPETFNEKRTHVLMQYEPASELRNHTHKFSSTNIRKHLLRLRHALRCSAQYTRGRNGAQWESFSSLFSAAVAARRRSRTTVKYICVTG